MYLSWVGGTLFFEACYLAAMIGTPPYLTFSPWRWGSPNSGPQLGHVLVSFYVNLTQPRLACGRGSGGISEIDAGRAVHCGQGRTRRWHWTV